MSADDGQHNPIDQEMGTTKVACLPIRQRDEFQFVPSGSVTHPALVQDWRSESEMICADRPGVEEILPRTPAKRGKFELLSGPWIFLDHSPYGTQMFLICVAC